MGIVCPVLLASSRSLTVVSQGETQTRSVRVVTNYFSSSFPVTISSDKVCKNAVLVGKIRPQQQLTRQLPI